MAQIVVRPEIASLAERPAVPSRSADEHVRPQKRLSIKKLFSANEFVENPGSSHRLRAEKPRETETLLRHFLRS